MDLRAALSPGEQKSYGHNSDTRAEGVLFFQSGVEAAAQRTQKKEKTDQAQSDSLIAVLSRLATRSPQNQARDCLAEIGGDHR